MTFPRIVVAPDFLVEPDVFRKPVVTPDQVRGRLFRDQASAIGCGRRTMRHRNAIGALVMLAAVLTANCGAHAIDEAKYPDLSGQWNRVGAPRWANPKTAPLTAEYRAIFEANLADQAAGGQGTDPTATCLAPGMPRV